MGCWPNRAVFRFTGFRIAHGTFHVEHLKAQALRAVRRGRGLQDLVACWPEPGYQPEPDMGRMERQLAGTPGWPSLCRLSRRRAVRDSSSDGQGGSTAARAQDSAANETIEQLGLDHKTLTAFRKAGHSRGADASLQADSIDGNQELLRRLDANEKIGQGRDGQTNSFFALRFVKLSSRRLRSWRRLSNTDEYSCSYRDRLRVGNRIPVPNQLPRSHHDRPLFAIPKSGMLVG